jgi:5-methylcytosine-specific restriction protein A
MSNSNNARGKVSIREMFTPREKKVILTKSNSKCCHCGKELTVKETTVEHVIPLSKGGSNNVTNLIALCDKCNKEKSNNIVSPKYQYKYLKKEYMDQLLKNFEEYQENDKNWFDFQTFFPRDEFRVPNYSPIIEIFSKNNKRKGISISKQFFDIYKQQAMQFGYYTFKRARFKDIPNIVEFFEYQSKHNRLSNFQKDTVESVFKEKLSDALCNGAVFCLKNGKNISAVYIFRISACSVYGEATFTITMESSYKMNPVNTCVINEYINEKLIKGLFCNNDFKYILMNSYFDKNDYRINPIFHSNKDSVLMQNYEEDLVSEMIMYERISNISNKKNEKGNKGVKDAKKFHVKSKNISEFDSLPEELKQGSEFFNKIVEMSDLTEKDVETFLEINEKIKSENVQKASEYEKKREEYERISKNKNLDNSENSFEFEEPDTKIGVAMLGTLSKKKY